MNTPNRHQSKALLDAIITKAKLRAQTQCNQHQLCGQELLPGRTKEAISAYREALEKNPEFNPARINLAYLYNVRGDNEQVR